MSSSQTMLTQAEQYLSYRRRLGFKMKVEGHLLLVFARYADATGHCGSLTTELAVRWARLPAGTSRLYQARRLEIIRCFAKYLVVFDALTEIPPNHILGSAHRRVQPYIFSPEEVSRLLHASQCLRPAGGLRSRTYVAFLGLLASTGLRPSEAVNLHRGDVDLQRNLLTVRETKFHKSRFVPLHPTAGQALAQYVSFRDGNALRPSSDAFFLSQKSTRLNLRTLHWTFREICKAAKIPVVKGARRPRLYDFRHTFACRRLLQWYQAGVDVHQALPALSTFLGHVKVSDTYWYLTGIPELFALVGNKFERYVCQTHGGQP